MTINTKNSAIFQKRKNLEGKQDYILIIKCSRCAELKKSSIRNKNCLTCLLNHLFQNKNKKFRYLTIESYDNLIEFEQISLFIEYFKKIKKIKKIYQKIEALRYNECIFRDFKCRIFSDSLSIFKVKNQPLLDPIQFYSKLRKSLLIINEIQKIHPNCSSCIDTTKSFIGNILDIMNNLKIINDFLKFEKIDENVESSKYYEFLITQHYNISENINKIQIINKRESLIETYNIGEEELFQISVYTEKNETEKKYIIKYNINSLNSEIFERITEMILKKIGVIKLDQIVPLEHLIKMYKKQAIKEISTSFHFNEYERSKIGFFAALKKLNLEKLFPLLTDDYIEEIFLDSPDDRIYINHQKHGRCRTDIKFDFNDIERIKTLLRLYSSQRLDYSNPSIKYVLKNKFFYCRFAVDIEPININNFSLDIRKLNKNILTIQDLLKNKTLNPLMAAFIYFNLIRRKNITVTGETDTGKTTLINSFDLLTPKEFRKIYIENIIESLNQMEFGKHQLKYKVNSLDNILNKSYSKSNHIKTLLHRSPDIIFLGEILTREETEALFHCLAAGLRGFQTIHSNDIDSLINRFLYHFKINISCLNDLNLIILMKKKNNKRRIVSISEVVLHNKKYYDEIFQYNPRSQKWDILKNLYKTRIIDDIKKYEDLSEEKFNLIIDIYQNIFNFLANNTKIKNNELVNLFHKISYYSNESIESLKQFLNNWKKYQGTST
jgi:type IV secretory pathway ATPase VirB11/archaellum biosynthesis ATPase